MPHEEPAPKEENRKQQQLERHIDRRVALAMAATMAPTRLSGSKLASGRGRATAPRTVRERAKAAAAQGARRVSHGYHSESSGTHEGGAP